MEDEMFPKRKRVESPASPTQAEIEIEQGWLRSAIERNMGSDPTWKIVEQQRAARKLAENVKRAQLATGRMQESLVRRMLEPGIRPRSLHDALMVPEDERTTEEAWRRAVTQGTDAAHAARLGAAESYGKHGIDL